MNIIIGVMNLLERLHQNNKFLLKIGEEYNFMRIGIDLGGTHIAVRIDKRR